MSEEITQIRDTSIIAAEIEVIKRQTQHMMLAASVEIGRRLMEAKELVPHGQWQEWLKEKVNYSQSTADNLMRITKEYGDNQVNLFSGKANSQAFENLTYSQAVALFALPDEQREEFVETHNVEDMSSRELKEAIEAEKKAKAETAAAAEKVKKLQNQLDGTSKELEIVEQKRDDLMQTIKKSDDENAAAQKKTADEIKKLQAELSVASAAQPPAPSPKELEKLRADARTEVEADFKKKEDQLTFDKKTAEEKSAEIKKSYEERLRKLKLDNESIAAQRQAAEKKLAVAAPEAQQCAAYLTSIQQNFNNATVIIHALEKSNPGMAEKLRVGICKVLDSMKEQVSQ